MQTSLVLTLNRLRGCIFYRRRCSTMHPIFYIQIQHLQSELHDDVIVGGGGDFGFDAASPRALRAGSGLGLQCRLLFRFFWFHHGDCLRQQSLPKSEKSLGLLILDQRQGDLVMLKVPVMLKVHVHSSRYALYSIHDDALPYRLVPKLCQNSLSKFCKMLGRASSSRKFCH
jgi:hypothetical protein